MKSKFLIAILFGFLSSCGQNQESRSETKSLVEQPENEENLLAKLEEDKESQFNTEKAESFGLSAGRKSIKIWHRVNRAYSSFLQRKADQGGLGFWLRSAQKTNCQNFAISFVSSAYGETKGLSAKDFTQRLYEGFLFREADKGGLSFWTRHTKRHGQMGTIRQFVKSAEFKRKMCW